MTKFKSYQMAQIAALGSLALLYGAWFFQAIGYAPCAMCIWQRYPHAVAIAFGVLLFFGLRNRLLLLGGALAAATTAAIGIFHTGVERDWWEGPTSCTGSGDGLGGLSGSDLLSTEGVADIVMCDEVVWSFLGLSMASWNAVFSLVLVSLWMVAFLRTGGRS